ncbi:MAG: hypothetical protein AVDCRST_MAG04-3758, partial [uncultured Acetobacteraceae bacterium]
CLHRRHHGLILGTGGRGQSALTVSGQRALACCFGEHLHAP